MSINNREAKQGLKNSQQHFLKHVLWGTNLLSILAKASSSHALALATILSCSIF